jgi:hypothetical protein
LTSFLLQPKALVDLVASAAGHVDLPFLVPVPASGMHITVQGVSRSSRSDRSGNVALIDVQEQLAEVDAFDATLADIGMTAGAVS